MQDKKQSLSKALDVFFGKQEPGLEQLDAGVESRLSSVLRLWNGESISCSEAESASAEIDSDHFSPIPQQIGAYSVQRQLGRGGFGEVFLAKNVATQNHVAIKRFDSQRARHREGFLREALILSQLKHPSIVTGLEGGYDAGCPFYVMEYVEGSSLAGIIGSIRTQRNTPGAAPSSLFQQPVKWTESALQQESYGEWIVRIALSMAQALAYIHKQGLIHQDFKPGNILVDLDGNAKLGDFGLAALESRSWSASHAGTYGYMAPELFDGEPPDPRSDLFSFGATFYEALTMQKAFPAVNREEAAALVKYTPVRSPCEIDPEIPASLEKIILKCLEKDKTRRYESADELVEDLRAVLGLENPLRRVQTRNDLGKWIGFSSAALVLGMLGVWLSSPSEATKEVASVPATFVGPKIVSEADESAPNVISLEADLPSRVAPVPFLPSKQETMDREEGTKTRLPPSSASEEFAIPQAKLPLDRSDSRTKLLGLETLGQFAKVEQRVIFFAGPEVLSLLKAFPTELTSKEKTYPFWLSQKSELIPLSASEYYELEIKRKLGLLTVQALGSLERRTRSSRDWEAFSPYWIANEGQLSSLQSGFVGPMTVHFRQGQMTLQDFLLSNQDHRDAIAGQVPIVRQELGRFVIRDGTKFLFVYDNGPSSISWVIRDSRDNPAMTRSGNVYVLRPRAPSVPLSPAVLRQMKLGEGTTVFALGTLYGSTPIDSSRQAHRNYWVDDYLLVFSDEWRPQRQIQFDLFAPIKPVTAWAGSDREFVELTNFLNKRMP